MNNLQGIINLNGKPISFDKKQHVFRQGELDEYIYYVCSGVLKAYYTSSDGKENVKSFITEQSVITSMSAAVSKSHCSFSLVAVEQSQLIKVPIDTFFKEASKNLNLANELNQLLLNLAMKKERREFELLTLSAEERCQLLLDEQPELWHSVTQNEIAQYLGITPVALSRIKKRITCLPPTEQTNNA